MSYMGEMEYTPKSLVGLLGTIKIVVQDNVLDDKIILMDRRMKCSVWDLETGIIAGECPMEDASEFHMSPKIYEAMMKQIISD